MKPPRRREWDKAAEELILRSLDRMDRDLPHISTADLEGRVLREEEVLAGLTDWVRKHDQFLRAVKANDFATFEQLMEDPELRRVVFQVLTERRRQGRQIGQSPLPERVRKALPLAAADKKAIREICRENGIRYHSDKATELATRRRGLRPKQLRNYLKNKSRRHK